MARIALNEDLEITLNNEQKVQSITFAKSGRKLPVTPLGAMEVNFRGPGETFKYIPASQVLADPSVHPAEGAQRQLASAPIDPVAEDLKDALVFIGLTAIGVFDMRAFPFDSNVAGVEGHANILDNLISGDYLISNSLGGGTSIIFILMTIGALSFAYLTQRLNSVPALGLFMASMAALSIFDQKILFEHNVNWNLGFTYIEIILIFMLTLAIKYVLEEKDKKFIRGAFSKYVAPAIVDSIIKDPTKLTVGGVKKELTILFSDIRGFTTFSERMDAKALAGFLNDYLGIMTNLVFEHEGTLDKYIGDAVMAFWGAPVDQAKHPANACKAAIHMLQALDQNRERFKTQYGVDVHIGIGINSGPVNVGNMGSEKIFEYTVIGDHVNLASRLEGLTKPYGASILTTRFTFDIIEKCGEPFPPHRVLDFVKVKGKKQAVELIQVLEREYAPEGLKLFEEARVLYTKQQWDQAIEKFKAANELLKRGDEPDAPTEMYIERCEEFKKSPPNADWDGSWEMTSK
jgi:adenylate cyclase